MTSSASPAVSPEEAKRRGDALYDEENFVGAMRWYRVAADQGDPGAQFYIAWLYFYGLGVDQDLDEASAWLTRAAELGESESIASMKAKIARVRKGRGSPHPHDGDDDEREVRKRLYGPSVMTTDDIVDGIVLDHAGPSPTPEALDRLAAIAIEEPARIGIFGDRSLAAAISGALRSRASDLRNRGV